MAIGRRVLILGGAGLAAGAVGGAVFAGSTYSSGWRMGMLSKFSLKGHLSKTGEGELMLGVESGIVSKLNGAAVDNPWTFSTTREVFERYRTLGGRLVAARFRELQANINPLSGDTGYRVDEIVAVDATTAPGGCALPNSGSGRSDGFRVGRIVKVTEKGTAFKTWELEMQVGMAGNNFHAMSILDERASTTAPLRICGAVDRFPSAIRKARSAIRSRATRPTK